MLFIFAFNSTNSIDNLMQIVFLNEDNEVYIKVILNKLEQYEEGRWTYHIVLEYNNISNNISIRFPKNRL
jgi:hypothetical protein